MAGLREQQKETRKKAILTAAKALFAELGHEGTTIEMIAENAGVSGVTVHNYYGTKSGVLLAVVADSDRALLETMNASLDNDSEDLVSIILNFSRIIREHAIGNLTKSIWRQVIAASISDAQSRFSKNYHTLDHQLSMALVRRLEQLQQRGRLSASVSAYDLGKALFNLQNARFIEFISFDAMTSEEIEKHLRSDITALISSLPEKTT